LALVISKLIWHDLKWLENKSASNYSQQYSTNKDLWGHWPTDKFYGKDTETCYFSWGLMELFIVSFLLRLPSGSHNHQCVNLIKWDRCAFWICLFVSWSSVESTTYQQY